MTAALQLIRLLSNNMRPTTGSSCLLSMLLVMVMVVVRLYPVILGVALLSP
jgi:hypothetical protein